VTILLGGMSRGAFKALVAAEDCQQADKAFVPRIEALWQSTTAREAPFGRSIIDGGRFMRLRHKGQRRVSCIKSRRLPACCRTEVGHHALRARQKERIDGVRDNTRTKPSWVPNSKESTLSSR